MRLHKKSNIRLFCFALCLNIFIISTALAQTFDQQFKSLVQKNLPNVAVGLVVQDATTGKILYESRAREGFTPASTTKLFTAAAALEYLKPNYQFETRLDFNPTQIENGILETDLYLTFTGDPTLTSLDLKNLFARLKNQGIRKLAGNIVIDHGRFETPYYASGWSIDDVQWHYGAPISAIIIDGNKIRQTAVENPEQLAIKKIQEIVLAEHLGFKGEILFSKKPTDNIIDHTNSIIHYSDNLETIVNHILRNSNNLSAEALTKTLGYHYYNKGTFQNGVLATHAILSPLTGIDFKKMRIHDGSGLSQYNCLAPNHLAKLLFSMYHNHELKTVFMNALPVSGKTGTLRSRLQTSLNMGQVQAKTGTLNGKSALAGYVNYTDRKRATHKTLIMVIMINQSVAPSADIKKLEDKIVNLILRHPGF